VAHAFQQLGRVAADPDVAIEQQYLVPTTLEWHWIKHTLVYTPRTVRSGKIDQPGAHVDTKGRGAAPTQEGRRPPGPAPNIEHWTLEAFQEPPLGSRRLIAVPINIEVDRYSALRYEC
jgi:hypothetical protein